MSIREIYFVDAVTGERPPSPWCDFPNYALAARQMSCLPKELVISQTGDMCSSTWVVEKAKLPQIMEHIYPRGASHYDHYGKWDWKAITDPMNGPTILIKEWTD